MIVPKYLTNACICFSPIISVDKGAGTKKFKRKPESRRAIAISYHVLLDQWLLVFLPAPTPFPTYAHLVRSTESGFLWVPLPVPVPCGYVECQLHNQAP